MKALVRASSSGVIRNSILVLCLLWCAHILSRDRGERCPVGLSEYDDTRVADDLAKRVTVFCWILTHPTNHYTKAIHTKHTWATRCSRVLYISDRPDPELGAIGMNSTPGRQHLASKSRMALDQLYRHHLQDADWFLKADDDTYVIMENLRQLLRDHDPEEPIFFGKRFNHPKNLSYHAGGAGYVLSRRALELFGIRPPGFCAIDHFDGSNEDVRVSDCLRRLGVRLGNSSDAFGRYRFHHFSPEVHILGSFPPWYARRSSLQPAWGLGEVSSSAISFHKVSPLWMYLLEYFVYDLRPYGIVFGKNANKSISDQLKASLEELRNNSIERLLK